MKYNTYYRKKNDRLLSNVASTFLIMKGNGIRGITIEGERIIYEIKNEIYNTLPYKKKKVF